MKKNVLMKSMAVVCLCAAPLFAEEDFEKVEIERNQKIDAIAAKGSAVLYNVIDGDSLRFVGLTCKIAGIDAPESSENEKFKTDCARHPEKNPDDIKKAGTFSKLKLLRKTGRGKEYKLEVVGVYHNPQDGHDRRLCNVYDNSGKSLADFMVSEGLAVPEWSVIAKENRARYKQMAESAKKAKKGIWGTKEWHVIADMYNDKEPEYEN